jgi:hypothetical protein
MNYSENAIFFIFIIIVILIIFFLILKIKDSPTEFITVKNSTQNELYFPKFSGTIMINELDQGSVTLWIVGGGVTKLVECSGGCSELNDPQSGLITFELNLYKWTRKNGNNSKYTFLLTKIRNDC